MKPNVRIIISFFSCLEEDTKEQGFYYMILISYLLCVISVWNKVVVSSAKVIVDLSRKEKADAQESMCFFKSYFQLNV